MKNLSFLFVVLVFISCKSFSQCSLIVEGGKIRPAQENLYLSDGYKFNLGCRIDFKRNFVWQNSFGYSSLSKNPAYSLSKEPDISIDPMLFPPIYPITYDNFSLNSNLGYVFLKEHRIQPFALAGLSANYVFHTYSDIEETDSHITNSMGIKNNQFHLGFQASCGINIRIIKRISAVLTFEYNSYPFTEIGKQKKNINCMAFQGGLVFKLKNNE